MPGREGCMPGGVCLGVSAGDVSAQGGDCLPRGVCLPGEGVCLPSLSFCPGSFCLPGGCLPSLSGGRGRGGMVVCVWHTPSMWTEFLTLACENITFLQLRLWMVKQECIPVICIPTAAVAATRCQYLGGLPLGGGSALPSPPFVNSITDKHL